jgi:hypothetical protein
MDLAFPSRRTSLSPPKSCAASARPSWGFFPFSDWGREVYSPGVPIPVRSAFRVFRPLDGLLPPLLSDLEGRYRSWGLGPPEPYPSAEPYTSRCLNPHAVFDIACSCSEDQEVTMPRNFRALLSAEIRTAANRGLPQPLLSWAFRRFGVLNHRSEVEPVSQFLFRMLKKPNSTSPSPPTHSECSRPAVDPVPKNRGTGRSGSEEPDPTPSGHPPGPVLGFSRQQ